MDEKNRRDIFTPAMAFLLAGLLAAYITAYFQLGQLGTVTAPGRPPAAVRTYRGKWQAELFTPAAIVESWILGHPMHLGHR
jgi:hypothetical protein